MNAARRTYQGVSLACLGLGGFLVVQGRALGLAGPFGPGPGFFAFWIGLALAALSLVWLGQVTRRPVPAFPPDVVPERAGLFRVAAVAAALAAAGVRPRSRGPEGRHRGRRELRRPLGLRATPAGAAAVRLARDPAAVRALVRA